MSSLLIFFSPSAFCFIYSLLILRLRITDRTRHHRPIRLKSCRFFSTVARWSIDRVSSVRIALLIPCKCGFLSPDFSTALTSTVPCCLQRLRVSSARASNISSERD
ncbi:hypothetical protein BKA61DRAFT_616216 [Leptodontidium sp. MPI-SDFR-AT-0119]|nr:hypothetical protein BKA61DRAFT_616216 [Leptodontidium sp. MPI-SDFR-AT-0119]